MLRLEALGHAIPRPGSEKERAKARKALTEPSRQNAAVDGRIRPASGQQAEEDEQTYSAGQRRLQEQGVVAAAHGVLAAIEAAMGQNGGKQAKRKRSRSLPEGHGALF